MSTPFANLLRCTLGTAEFQLDDYAYSEEAVVEEGKGRTGTQTKVSGQGWVSGATAATFCANLAAVVESFRVAGQDFAIWGLDQTTREVDIPAARCLNGGPHVSFEIEANKGGAGLNRRISFSLECGQPFTPSGSGGGEPVVSYKVATQYKADLLRVVTYSGDVKGKGSEKFFREQFLPPLYRKYSPELWVFTHDYASNARDDEATFSATWTELRDPLPFEPGGTATVLDGTMTTSVERDEQMRLVTKVEFDYLITGDAIKLRDRLREAAGKAVEVVKERYAVVAHPQRRLSGAFEFLASATADDLLGWERSLTVVEPRNAATLAFEEVPGANVTYWRKPAGAPTYRETGRAVGRGRFPRAPALLVEWLGEAPKEEYAQVNGFECVTTWERLYAPPKSFEFGTAVLAKLARPEKPEFWGGGAAGA